MMGSSGALIFIQDVNSRGQIRRRFAHLIYKKEVSCQVETAMKHHYSTMTQRGRQCH